MRPMYTPKRRQSRFSMFVVFMLGCGVGASLMYAYVDVKRPKTPPAPGAVEVAQPVEEKPVASEPAPPPPAPVPEPKSDSADTGGLWPARHLFIGIEGTTLSPETRALIAQYKPGGVVLRAENVASEAQTRLLCAQVKDAAGLGMGLSQGPLMAIGQEGGSTPELNPLRLDPSPSARAVTASVRGGAEGEAGHGAAKPGTAAGHLDYSAVRATAQRYTEEAMKRGIGVLFSPVLDVFRPGISAEEWRERTFGDDEEVVGRTAIPFVQSILETGGVAVAKYYPGLATAAVKDGLATLEASNRVELARLLLPFDKATRAKVSGILVAPVAVPLVGEDNPERVAPQKSAMLGGVLRNKLVDYKGVILAGEMPAGPGLVADSPADNIVASLAAGCDGALMMKAGPAELAAVCEAIAKAVKEPESGLTKARLDESKTRLAAWNEGLARFDAKYPLTLTPPATEIPAEGEAPKALEGEVSKALEGEGSKAPEGETPKSAEGEAGKPAVEGEVPTPKAASAKLKPAEGEAAAETSKGKKSAAEKKRAKKERAQTAEDPAGLLQPVEVPEESASPAPARAEQPANTRLERHRVEKGESLTEIAGRYGVSVNNLKEWNGLEDATIKYGASLRVYVPEKAPANP